MPLNLNNICFEKTKYNFVSVYFVLGCFYSIKTMSYN